MYKNKRIIGIIPARGGSKGLPGKNKKVINGKPLVAWSIDAGLNSKYLDEVMVSTDCEQIAEISRSYGASVPFLRDGILAGDNATSYAVVENVINYYKNELLKSFDFIMLLEPTSPLREVDDIDNSIEILLENKLNAEAIVGVCKTECQNPAFLVEKDKNGFISGLLNSGMKALRRQDIRDIYFLEGTIYLSDTNSYLTRKSFYHEKTIGYEVPKWKSLEIDDIYDFVMTEAIMKLKGFK